MESQFEALIYQRMDKVSIRLTLEGLRSKKVPTTFRAIQCPDRLRCPKPETPKCVMNRFDVVYRGIICVVQDRKGKSLVIRKLHRGKAAVHSFLGSLSGFEQVRRNSADYTCE